jgi:hypothetical protein
MDPFNYTVFQTSSNGAPYMRGEYVSDVAHNHSTFRVRFIPTSFVPDANSVLLVEYVTDLAGTPVWPRFVAITPCPAPVLERLVKGEVLIRRYRRAEAYEVTLEFKGSVRHFWEPVTNSVSSIYGLSGSIRRKPGFYRLHKSD